MAAQLVVDFVKFGARKGLKNVMWCGSRSEEQRGQLERSEMGFLMTLIGLLKSIPNVVGKNAGT